MDSLKLSIKTTIEYFISEGVRKLKVGITVDQEIKKIKTTSDKTLGKLIDEITAAMFIEEEKISKLSISLDYEDRVTISQSELPKDTQITVEILKTLLRLRGEKSAEKSVFEEVPPEQKQREA